jgi:hypothetical protein
LRTLAGRLKGQIETLNSLNHDEKADPSDASPSSNPTDNLPNPPLAETSPQSEDTESDTSGDIKLLEGLVNNRDLAGATFPVYGPVNAGKSTFLAFLLREKLLPEESLSIPIRIRHVARNSSPVRLTIPQCDKWNACASDFRDKLIAGSLALDIQNTNAVDGGDQYANVRDLINRIKNNPLTFPSSVEGEEIRPVLNDLSHFVRTLWLTDVDYEKDHGIIMDTDMLPLIEMSFKSFEGFGDKSFSLLDTPGPNEATGPKVLMVLQQLAPKVMRLTSGW